MNIVIYEILGLLALIMANGVFAMSEIAVVSARKARLQDLAEQGVRGAGAALALANNPGAFLATVQIGITLIGILAGAFGGTTIARVLAEWFASADLLRPYASELGFAVTVAAITYLSLVIGELVPKRISIGNAERIAARVAVPMQLLSRAAHPAVRILDYSSSALLWLLRIKPTVESPVTEDELRILVAQATSAGVLEKAEHEMMTNVLDFGDRTAASLMTRGAEIVFLSTRDSLEECWAKIRQSGHTHFPLCAGSLDETIGMISVDSLVGEQNLRSAAELERYAKTVLYVPETARAMEVLESFKRFRKHAAIVIDEYGNPKGLITLVDVLEALVGAVPLSAELEEHPILQRSDGTWLVDGLLAVAEFREYFKTGPLPHQGHGDFDTIGGFVMTRLGRIPRLGDRFEWGGYRFEVVDMDGKRVDKVLVTTVKGKGK